MNFKKNIPVYLLCGGKSTRMGTDKGLVSLKDKSFIQLIINVLNKLNLSLFLVTENLEYVKFSKPLISDLYTNKGPLGGIHAALSHSKANKILILSCDIPLITTETIQTIVNTKNENNEIVFAADEERWHPLIGVYSKNLLHDLEISLEENRLKLIDFIKDHNYKEIKIDNARSLTNINTIEELIRVENNLT